jgi:hypothetical protein
MNKEYGGKQRYMHESRVTKEMLGPHKPLLPLNAIQKMTYTSVDDGPFYMDPIEKELLKNHDLVGEKFVMKDRKSMVREILNLDSIPENCTRMKIGMQTVLINRRNEDIYESEQVLVPINLLRKFYRENRMSWRMKVTAKSKEVWKAKTRIELLGELIKRKRERLTFFRKQLSITFQSKLKS